MAGEVAAGAGTIDKGAKIVADKRSEFDSQRREIESRLAAVRAGWEGQSAMAFSRLLDAWNGQAQKVIAELNGVEANLRSSQGQITQTESESTDAVSKIAGLLG